MSNTPSLTLNLKYGQEVPDGVAAWQGYIDNQINKERDFSDVDRSRYFADLDAHYKEKEVQANYDT